MIQLTNLSHAASSVAQPNQGRGRGLGRGPHPISKRQSPYSLKKLKILQCNINGITTLASRAKLDELLKLAEKNDAQVIALQETKLNLNKTLKYKGYNILRKDRSTKSGGGLAFFIREIKYQSINIPLDLASDLEIQGIEILWRGKPLNIFNVYHPPTHKHISDSFSNFMDKNSIIIGDLNAKHTIWGCSGDNERGIDILQMMDDNEFLILNDGTHTHRSFSYNTSEALDIAMTSAELFPQYSWSVLDNIGSDHLPILIEFSKRQKTSQSKEKFWNFNKANWASFRDSIDKVLPAVPVTENINKDWENFKNIILKSARAHIPRGNVKGYIPHYNQNTSVLESLIEQRKSLLETTGPADHNSRSKINKINAEIKLTYAHLKRSRWKELCSKIDARTPNTKLWKIAKGINKEQIQHEECNSIRNANGKIFPDDKSAANGLAAHYQSIGRLEFTNEDKIILTKSRNIVHGCRSSDLGDSILSESFSMNELLTAMTFLDLTNSPGPDGLSGRMLENLGCLGKQRLIDIFNLSWQIGHLPKEWKRAIIIPIKKTNKNKCVPEDFRPIALTCTASKIIEKMILIRLQFFLDNNNLFPGEQYGFRRGHSTIDLVLYFAQTIRDAQNLKPTHHTVAALMDLSKAFDRVWKHKLIIKLHNTFNIRGKTLAWISDYLHQRFIRVKFNKMLSDSFFISQGVPQGTVLSPTLFSMYLAGAERVVSSGTRMGLFADDIALWCSGTNLDILESNLNDSLKALSVFAKDLKLNFNAAKSIATLFTTNKHLYNYQPKLIFENQNLAYEKHPKYLGYILDPEFTSNKHIDYIVLKARKRLNILKYIAGKDWGADASTLRTTYLALIRPILEYGFPVFCCASVSNLKKLDQVHLSAARIITGLKRSCPSDIVLYEADLEPLHIRRQANLKKFFSKLFSYGYQNNTSKYLCNWENHQRLKKNSPFSQAFSQNAFTKNVEPHTLHSCMSPTEDLSKVHFHFNLSSSVNKKNALPDHLRQLALEIINNIPKNDTKLYTDGSKTDNLAGSGIYIETPHNSFTLSQRNPDFCSVLRSELLAMDAGIEAILKENDYGNLWILTDSRSSMEHLKNWIHIGDKTSISILHKLKRISLQHEIHFQWIPSHVDLFGNEKADSLAKEGCSLTASASDELTYLEHFSQMKNINRRIWPVPPTHDWYRASKPGLSLLLPGDRRTNTCLSRLASGHLKCLSFSQGVKSYPLCPKCHQHQASAEHILSCLELLWEEIYTSPLLVFDFLFVNGFVDLV